MLTRSHIIVLYVGVRAIIKKAWMLGAGFSHARCLRIMDSIHSRHWTGLTQKTLEITLVPLVNNLSIYIAISTVVEGQSFTGGELFCRRYHH